MHIHADKDILNRLFPKMEALDLEFVDHDKSFFVNTNHYLNLKNLSIVDWTDSSSICGNTMAPILHLNPQIENIFICTDMPLFDSIEFQNDFKNLQKL